MLRYGCFPIYTLHVSRQARDRAYCIIVKKGKKKVHPPGPFDLLLVEKKRVISGGHPTRVFFKLRFAWEANCHPAGARCPFQDRIFDETLFSHPSTPHDDLANASSNVLGTGQRDWSMVTNDAQSAGRKSAHLTQSARKPGEKAPQDVGS